MNALPDMQIELTGAAGARMIGAQELPLAIGGAGAEIEVAGAQRGTTLAVLGVDEHGLYVEPEDNEARLNGQPLTERIRPTHGDVLSVADGLIFFLLNGPRVRLQIEEAKQQRTAPPVIEEEATHTDFEEEADALSIQRANFRPVLRAQAQGPRRREPQRWIIAAAVGLLAAMLWFLMSSNSVLVISDPKDAKADFSGGFVVGVGGQYLLRHHPYKLVVTREGFETVTQQVEVTGQPNQQVRIHLQKLPGESSS